jgi:dephospho-CoA kinase
MIIGITGTIGAGKGTVVEYLKSKGFTHYSASGLLKEIATERGLPLTRTHLSPLADELAATHEGGIFHLMHERAVQEGAVDYVLESIHRPSEAEYVRSIGGVILGVDADLRTRYERTVARKEGEKDDVTFEQFVEHSKREDDGATGTGPNIRAVLATADGMIENNGTIDDLHSRVDYLLTTLFAIP